MLPDFAECFPYKTHRAGIHKLQLYDMITVMTNWNVTEPPDCVICDESGIMDQHYENTGHWTRWLSARTFTHRRMMVCKHTVNAVMLCLWFPLHQGGSTESRRPQSCIPDVVSNTSKHQNYRQLDRGTDLTWHHFKNKKKKFKKFTIWSIRKRIKTNKWV